MTKRRAHGDGGIDPRGENIYRLRYRVNRKRFTKTFHGSRGEARKELRRLVKSADDGAHIAPSKITLAQWIAQWLALLERKPEDETAAKAKDRKRPKRGRVSMRTLERYSDLMRLHVVPKLGTRPLQKIMANEIDALYVDREQVLAPRTVHHIHVALKACLSVAVRKKLRPDNPADDAEPPTFVEGEAGPVLDQAELALLLQGFKGRAIYPVILTLAFTGARLNEVLALQWADINFEAKTLSIIRAVEPTKKHGRRIKAPKTARGVRTITIDDALVKMLRERHAKHLRLVAGIPDGAEVDTSLVRLPEGALIFPGDGGTDLLRTRNHHSIENDFRQRADKIGFVSFRLHDLRGTHSTMLLDAGVPVHVVAARIGDDPATLLRIYAKRTRKADTSAADVIATLSASVLGGTP
jgi:integrase